MAHEEAPPKIASDEDWKRQAQQEKEKLGQEAAAGLLPPANFVTHLESIVIQILYCLGQFSSPDGAKGEVNLDLAKHHIDTLTMLEEKTKGNRTDEESKALALRLHEVRMQYVGAAQTNK